jgi:hypothetical protein
VSSGQELTPITNKKIGTNDDLKNVHTIEKFSIEIFLTNFYADTVYSYHDQWLMLENKNMRCIGGKISFFPNPKIRISLAGSYNNTKNLSGNVIILDLFGPPEFSLIQFSFESYYNMINYRWCDFYIGGGLSLFKANIFLNGRNMKKFYLKPSINAGFNFYLSSPIYLCIHGDGYFQGLKWGSQEVYFDTDNFLFALNIGLGYRF